MPENWQGFAGLNYAHIEFDQSAHTNIAGGAIGPSAGAAKFDYIGTGLSVERRIENFGVLGLGAGIGALFHDVSGSFRASGATAALRFDIYSLFDVGPRASVGPFSAVIIPLDDVSGGAGAANSRYKADPIFLFGVRIDFSLRPKG